MKKSVAILGSTGSIGRNALLVISRYPERFRVTGLSAHRNISLLVEQIETFHPKVVAVTDPPSFQKVSKLAGHLTKVLPGEKGAIEVATHKDVDMVVSSMVGAAGLKPTLAAIQAGKDIALANKETMVIGGKLIMQAVSSAGVRLIPIDSEHSAIFQSILGHSKKEIHRLILTASGGPFRTWPMERMKTITPSEALHNPNWEMGTKVTIDSATMMNKGLEVIEARWLFDVEPDSIDILIHPESIIHSMVEYIDGVVIAQLGIPDMRIPIAYALGYPERMDIGLKRLDLTEIGRLTFERPDMDRFPTLKLAYDAIGKSKTFPSVLNAANEVAVNAFLSKRISFIKIPEVVSYAMENHEPMDVTLENIMAADQWGRKVATKYIERTLRKVS